MTENYYLNRFICSFGFKYLCLAVLLIAAAGCGNGLAKVKGEITFDGQPLASTESIRAKVVFYPEVGTGAPALGTLDEDGTYQLMTGSQKGVAPGSYLISISAIEIIPPKSIDDLPGGKIYTPTKYANPKTSGFTALVESGSNSFDFNLEPEPKRSSRVSRRR